MSLYYAGVRLCSGCSIAVRDAKQAKKARTRAKRQPREDRETIAAAEATDRSLRIRGEAIARALGTCELCGEATADHLHHLEPGNGTRRQRERVENTMACCAACHRSVHDKPSAFVIRVKAWAAEHGYSLPNRRIYK